MSVGGAGAVEQQRGRHLDEAEAAVGEFARLDPQVGDVVEREAEAALGERREALDARSGPCRAIGALREFEHQRRRDRAVGVEEIEELRENPAIGQRRRATDCRTGRCRDSSEQAGAPPARSGTAPGCRSSASGRPLSAMARKSAAGDDLAVLGAQPRHRLVVAHLALRQRHDRLQVEIDAVGVGRLADRGDDALRGSGRGSGGAPTVSVSVERQRAGGFGARTRRPARPAPAKRPVAATRCRGSRPCRRAA